MIDAIDAIVADCARRSFLCRLRTRECPHVREEATRGGFCAQPDQHTFCLRLRHSLHAEGYLVLGTAPRSNCNMSKPILSHEHLYGTQPNHLMCV